MTTVVKVGGSLSADPDRLRATLTGIADGTHGPCIVVPGGGPFADAVRARQARDGFDDATAHRLALDAMGRMGELFRAFEPRLGRTVTPWVDGLFYLPPGPADSSIGPASGRRREGPGNPLPLAGRGRGGGGAGSSAAVPPEPPPPPTPPHRGEERRATVWDPAALRAGHPDVPETWDVTSDSLALWLAARLGAKACMLVKSADAPGGCDAADLARLGLVDAAFPRFAARYAGAVAVWGPGGPVAVARRSAA